MEKTEVPGLMRQSHGVFTNTSDEEYHAYIRRRDAANRKDEELSELRATINILMERLNKLENK